MLIRSFALALGVGALLVACGDDGGGGAAPTPDAGVDLPGPRARLTFLRASVDLLQGESLEVGVRYLRADGSPAVDTAVELGLLGEAHDSSLDAECVVDGAPAPCLTPRTDATGTAYATIRAGATSAVFRVRARAPDADPAILEVAVGDGGFGALQVALPYTGALGVSSRTVRLFTGAACGDDPADLLSRVPDRSRTVGPMLDQVELGSLPASRRYTLLAIGRGPTPHGEAPAPTLALGCREDVEVTAGTTAGPVTVPLEDLPRVVDGRYRVGLVVVGTAHPPRVGEAVLDAAQDAVDAAGGEASLVLAALAAVLEANGEDEALAALEAAVAGDGARSLRSRLDGSRQGALDGADWLARALEEAVGTFHVGATLDVALAEPEPTRWAVTSLRAGVDADALDLSLDAVAGIALSSGVDWDLPDAARAAPLALDLPLGTASVAAVAALLARGDAPSTPHLLADEVGCSALETWIQARPDLAEGCDEGCARATCEAAFGAATEGLEARLRTLDVRRPGLRLEGPLAVEAAPGDAFADRVGAERLTGAWFTEAGERFDPCDGAFVAERVIDP